jgi:membrane protease YdiL (CAAX protease family)
VDQAVQSASDAAQKASAATGLDVVTLGAFVLSVLVLLGLFLAKVLRPSSMGAGLRKTDVHPGWVWVMCGVMVFFTTMLGASIAAMIPQISGPGPATPGAEQPLQYRAVTGLCGYVLALTIGAVLVRLIRASAPQAGLDLTGRSVAWGIVSLILALPLVYSAGMICVMIQQAATGKEISSHLAHPILQSLNENPHSPWAWVVGFISIVMAPLQEEIVFRGFLQTGFLTLLKRPWLAILMSSCVFGLAHLGAGMPWYGIVPVFVLGLAMGLAFEKTRSLGTAITMHVLFNGGNVVLAMMGK